MVVMAEVMLPRVVVEEVVVEEESFGSGSRQRLWR
jgi:hypothetical protein